MSDEDTQVGERIRLARAEKQMTQAQLAERMSDLGHEMQQQTILKIEKGSRSLKLTEAIAMSMALGKPIGALVPESPEREVVARLRMMAGDVYRRKEAGLEMMLDAELDSRRLEEAIAGLPADAQSLVPADVLALAGRTAEELFEDIKLARKYDEWLQEREAAQKEQGGKG